MSEPLHDIKGVVPLFEKGSLNANEPFSSSPLPNFEENLIYAQYDKRLKSYLIGALDIFRQYEIFLPESNIEDFQSLVELVQKQLIPEVEVQMALDCNDVENCLDTSPIITNIENSIVSLGDTVNNHTTEINNINEVVENIEENSTYNEFPEYPDPTEAIDDYCGASWSIANYLHDYIQDVITDAQTITFAEFIVAILPLGGFKTSLVKIVWDLIVSNLNPNLSTEVTDALPKVAEHIFCNALDMTDAKADIIADGTITSDAEATYIAAINSLTDAKFNELVYIGSLDNSQNCNTFGCGWALYDFTKGLHGFNVTQGVWTAGQGLSGVSDSNTVGDMIFTPMSETYNMEELRVELLWTGTKGSGSFVLPNPVVNGTNVNVGQVNTGTPPIGVPVINSMFISTSGVNGFKFRIGNTNPARVYLRKAWLRYTKVTGSPENSAPIAP